MHVAVEFDTPLTREEYDEVVWFLLHEDVQVYIDDEDKWYLEFKTKCTPLGEDGRCSIYGRRPQICRDYETDSCVRHGDGSPYKHYFTTVPEFESFWREKHGPWPEN